jgi:hypothetical protein
MENDDYRREAEVKPSLSIDIRMTKH